MATLTQTSFSEPLITGLTEWADSRCYDSKIIREIQEGRRGEGLKEQEAVGEKTGTALGFERKPPV